MAVPDKLFSYLKTHITNPPLSERVRWAWISDETRASIDARVTVRREEAQCTVWKISQRIRTGIITDQKRWAEEAGPTTESLLASDPLIVR